MDPHSCMQCSRSNGCENRTGNHYMQCTMALTDCLGEGGDGRIAVRGDGRRGALDDARPRTGWDAVKATVGQHAERVDVGGDRRLAALHLFRCAVAGCADAAKGNVRCRTSGVGRRDVLDKAQVGQDRNGW